jgi:hypothetical protein
MNLPWLLGCRPIACGFGSAHFHRIAYFTCFTCACEPDLLAHLVILCKDLACLSDSDGVVAQLVERLVRNEKVAGSIPVGSTILHIKVKRPFSVWSFSLPHLAVRLMAVVPADCCVGSIREF